MLNRPAARQSLVWLLAIGLVAEPVVAQVPSDSARVSIVYTGRSLGALGVRRAQDEHELLTEQASAEHAPFKLVSHLAWRATGIVIFLPGSEPEGHELAWAIAHRAEAERLEGVRALRSDNVLLVQDPWREEPDLFAMLDRNPRRRLDHGDLVETRVTASRLRPEGDNRIVIIEEPGAVWTEDPSAWSVGEMNRVDVLDSRVFELPLNLGGLGPRATLVRAMRAGAARPRLLLTVDLGHQTGESGVSAADRATLDFTALRALGYTASVPFDFELGLGAEGLAALRTEYPEIAFFAANVRVADSTFFVRRRLVGDGAVRVGLVGLVDPGVRDRLPRAALADLTFESPVVVAQREVALLRAEGASAVVVLSNLDPADNAALANEVSGIDVILAEMPVRWSSEMTRTRIEVPDRPFVRPGAPVLVARSAANGLGVGRLDLEFRLPVGVGTAHLTAVEHITQRVTDRTPSDTALVRAVTERAALSLRARGELMVPAFVDLVARHPTLAMFEGEATPWRIPQPMWEGLMARILRVRSEAEVAVIRRLEQFPPLIGKLHENEIGAWLWTEDEIVVVDLLGADLRALLRSDTRGTLATSGIDVAAGTVLGHPISDQVYYRVATSDVLFEGARGGHFARARRVRRHFRIGADGMLVAEPTGSPLALRDLVFGELQRLRAQYRGDAHLDAVAAWLQPDPGFVRLLSVTFDRPNLFFSASQVQGATGYGSVAESRITSANAWVAGISGRFVVTHTRPVSATDFGVGVSFARQAVRIGGGEDVRETADDLRFDVTLRPTGGSRGETRFLPFARGEFDTEFTPTVDLTTGASNARELTLRAIGGVLLPSGAARRRVEFALAIESDLGHQDLQYGVQSRTEFVWAIGRGMRGRSAPASYRLRNDLTYLLPSPADDATRLALRYNMVHEVVVPLVDELALALTADLFFFQGKVPATRAVGSNAQLRVGLTYDRLWKPRYQPFF